MREREGEEEEIRNWGRGRERGENDHLDRKLAGCCQALLTKQELCDPYTEMQHRACFCSSESGCVFKVSFQ